jgi:molecular chaperone GrpE
MKKRKNIENLNKEKAQHTEDIQTTDTAEMNPAGSSTRQDDKECKESSETPEQLIKISELNDKYLRLYSEFENYRKRTIKEKIELSKTASMDVIIMLLPVLDDFDRAVKTIENSAQPDPFSEGVVLIYNKLKKTLNQLGVEEIKASGEVFSTDMHEAVTNVPAADETMKGKVIEEIQKGYLMNGKVIRYAKVIVGS